MRHVASVSQGETLSTDLHNTMTAVQCCNVLSWNNVLIMVTTSINSMPQLQNRHSIANIHIKIPYVDTLVVHVHVCGCTCYIMGKCLLVSMPVTIIFEYDFNMLRSRVTADKRGGGGGGSDKSIWWPNAEM